MNTATCQKNIAGKIKKNRQETAQGLIQKSVRITLQNLVQKERTVLFSDESECNMDGSDDSVGVEKARKRI